MKIINEILSNHILITGAVGWALAQILKTIIHAITYHGIDLKRLLGDGGMPSAHSTTVTAIAVSAGIECGFDSAYFAIACILAFIVMHDATGVRRETGKQAKIINEILDEIYKGQLTPEETLKEFVGHTPFQVLMGFLFGIAVAVIFHLTIFR